MINAKNIHKSFSTGEQLTKVVKDVSLTISKGTFTVILGPSGSGKSTLLNLLSGLEQIDEGRLSVGSQDLSKMSEKERTLFRKETTGFVFQQYYLLPELTVEMNIKMGAELANNKEYLNIVEAVGLKDKLKKYPSALSGGEQQRVSIARALAKKPEILFLDEPTGALDETTGRSVLDYLAKLQEEMNLTMIMVTHNLNIAEMADTVVEVNSGEIKTITQNSTKKNAYEIGW
ncbi:hypothetical protein IGI37_000707 [Enterococcus sp. AZ194]|uniref:ABC transporter ATP-binding protein n=1 Tax=Enterococcus sp. AZ194 TaxID=2774629 RepID=UPI003F269A00